MRVTPLHRLCWIALTFTVSFACAARTDPGPRADGAPQLTWELLSGDRRGDEDAVCDSKAPEKCVLAVTTDTRRTLALVRLRLHPAAREISYIGTVEIPFFDGPNEFDEVSVTVPADARPVNRSLLGRVTREPGTYTMAIALDALVKGDSSPTRIFEQVTVTVR